MAYVADPITAADTFKVTVRMTLAEQRLMMVLYARPFTILVNAYADAAQNFADSLGAAMINSLFWEGVIAEQSNELSYDSITVQRVAVSREVMKTFTFGSLVGGVASPAMPPNVALSVTKRTELPLPNGVGRIQVPGLPETATTLGRWDSATVGTVEDSVASSLLTEFTDQNNNEWRWCLFTPLAGLDVHPDITSVVAHDTVRTMHRRTVGLGE